MAKRAIIYFGPRKAFDDLLRASINSTCETTVSYLEAIRVYNARVKASDLATRDLRLDAPDEVDNCIVYAEDFGSVLSHVIANFNTILEETYEIGTLYIQNPPKRAFDSVYAAYSDGNVEVRYYEYPSIDKKALPGIYKSLKTGVLGQQTSKVALITSLYRLSVMKNEKPAVILMCGPSGVGKTETAKCLAKALGGGLTSIQFSMMQTNEAYEYLFGAEHSKASFARDLLNRESNVILIDEFDKANSGLYNMFYQLFDEGRYIDTNYDVDARECLFLLTSNFQNENAARKALGDAIYSRISACVCFEDLDEEAKVEIINRYYARLLSQLDDDDCEIINASGIKEWFVVNAGRYNNVRTMKAKIEKAVFEKLAARIFEELI